MIMYYLSMHILKKRKFLTKYQIFVFEFESARIRFSYIISYFFHYAWLFTRFSVPLLKQRSRHRDTANSFVWMHHNQIMANTDNSDNPTYLPLPARAWLEITFSIIILRFQPWKSRDQRLDHGMEPARNGMPVEMCGK